MSTTFEDGVLAVERRDAEPPKRAPTSRELDLLRAAQEGDEQALAELCELCWRPVYRSVARWSADRTEAEDTTQEVFLRALRSISQFEDRGVSFMAYLLRIADNLVRDRWRSRPSRSLATADVPEAVAPARGPDEVVVDNERRRALLCALDRLSPDHRAVLRMRILEGRSTHEVAALTHRNPPAVRQLQVRALAALRAELVEGDN